MRSIIYSFCFLSLVLGIIAAPVTVDLGKRPRSPSIGPSTSKRTHLAGPDLEISLRETNKGQSGWHFGLVIHTPGEFKEGAKRNIIYEYVRAPNSNCLEYSDERNGLTNQKQLSVSGKLIPFDNESDDAALLAKSKDIIKTKEKSDATVEGYKNCFDFAVEAVARLHENGYVSAADYAKFKNYHVHGPEVEQSGKEKFHDKVRDKTAGHVVAEIAAEKKAKKEKNEKKGKK